MMIACIGVGHMMRAMIQGMMANEVLSSPHGHHWLLIQRSPEKLQPFLQAHTLSLVENKIWTLPEAMERGHLLCADIVILGVKPQHVSSLGEIVFSPHQVIVSLIASWTLGQLKKRFPTGEAFVRLMPSLSVAQGEGVILQASGPIDEMAKTSFETFQRIQQTLGTTYVIEEERFHEMTLLSGCAPAYVAWILYQLTSSLQSKSSDGQEMQLRSGQLEEEAFSLLSESMFFALKKLRNQKRSELITFQKQVASKGGITEAVLETWDQLQVGEKLQEGLRCGLERARSLGPSE